jgi:hypothetical protein
MQRITAMGGGGFLMEGTPLLDDFILSRARASRVCFVATASGDHDRMLVNFYAALGPHCRATHLPLFRRQHADVVAHLLAQDVIDVGGGTPPTCSRSGASTASTWPCAAPTRPASCCAASALARSAGSTAASRMRLAAHSGVSTTLSACCPAASVRMMTVTRDAARPTSS